MRLFDGDRLIGYIYSSSVSRVQDRRSFAYFVAQPSCFVEMDFLVVWDIKWRFVTVLNPGCPLFKACFNPGVALILELYFLEAGAVRGESCGGADESVCSDAAHE